MANLLEARGDGRRVGITGVWNRFFVHSRAVKPDFSEIVVSFDGPEEPMIAFKYLPDKLVTFYKPTAPGDYLLSVKKEGEDIKGSPFKCKVTPPQTGDPNLDKIKFEGNALTEGKINVINEFTVDFTQVNCSEDLKVSMKGPTFQMRKYGGPETSLSEIKPRVKKVTYKPKFAAKYKIYLQLEGKDIPGSPFTVNVTDPGAPPPQPQGHLPIKNAPIINIIPAPLAPPKRILFTQPQPKEFTPKRAEMGK